MPWAEYARKAALTDVVLTDHGRYHKGVNFEEFLNFKNKINDINFKIGIEIDNNPETSETDYKWTEKNFDKLDFILGSVHFIDKWAFDHPNYKDQFSKWNIDELYSRYFENVKRLINKGFIDGLAHLDLIKIFGDRSEKKIKYFVEDILKLIKQKGLAIEINTAGWRKPVNELYPQHEIVLMIKEMDIPITTASDAHTAKDLGYGYDRLYKMLKDYRFNQVAIFEKHKMKLISI